MAMNPFAAHMGYQNPNHNRPTYSTNAAANPFGPGPTPESWQKDVNELGFNVKLATTKPQNDNVPEFKDLFSVGLKKFETFKAPPKTSGIDLTYNPGVPQQT